MISYAQNAEDVVLWRALHDVAQGFYVDVGAGDHSLDSTTRWFYDNGWRGINIEPLKVHFDTLQAWRPRDINLCCAAGAAAGTTEIWQCGVRGWATITPAIRDRQLAAGLTTSASLVPVETLASICAQHAPGTIHFLKIDVEGAEAEVLRGMDLQRFRPWIIVLEATLPGTRVENYGEWEFLLLGAEYEHVYADGLNRFYVAREHGALTAHFKYPPNLFDDFRKWEEVEAEARADAADRRLVEREAQLTHLLARAEAAENRVSQLPHLRERAEAAESRVFQLERSSSWRMTRPLRILASLLYRPRPSARGMLGYLVRGLKSRPVLLRLGASLLVRFPGLRDRIRLVLAGFPSAGPTGSYIPPRLASLSPRERRLHQALEGHTPGHGEGEA